MTPEQEKVAYEELKAIQRERGKGNFTVASQMVEDMRLVMEIERTKAADRQAEALEKLAKSAEMSSIAFSAVVGAVEDMASGMNALVATLKSASLTVEDLADHDQGELFEEGCACGRDHSAIG